MYADLVLYTEPRRPLINPKFDLFAYFDATQQNDMLLFPARIVDKLRLMLPDKCKSQPTISDDIWEFIIWQAEEKGYAVVRSIDNDWLYWSVLADKYTLLNMVRIIT